ncbi:MAG TPA: hypothetical protein VE870_15500, partial [Bacteroidales bacterium]|nr:hypothetical protein [Bacteroidales bacterium]
MKKSVLLTLLVVSVAWIDGSSQDVRTDGSQYRRIKSMSDSTFLVQEFDHDSVMLFIGTFTSLEPEIRNGRFRFYNNEGKVEVAGFYYHDIPYGKWVYYDDNGKITRVLDY